ncbi:molybdopterin synthase catalytic subunit [Catalinimonas alkaloidigena]|uniref:Molybdopterin synthase catalytic subunit n=1 Tax=Catalinimonas alkaloidigena TaxID=1075417 RepID=A0A1G9ENG7_9BACT|nr:molybdenum cofactor biosynthesis protein MoaE [Catalinimonas alkaloidigena]SDK77623.1 molybdopterin synthase catalytic subunit [Catalinimonas alkaloidigena]
MPTPYLHLTDQPLDTQEAIDRASSDAAGAVDVFLGIVRNKTADRPVVRLEYEAYDPMALREMEKIAAQAAERWPVQGLSIVHRKGTLHIGDLAVVIAVSTPHRREAFEACRFVIDTLKETVPIWKKEVFEDGEIWVSAHP